jgi:hypothetical protein
MKYFCLEKNSGLWEPSGTVFAEEILKRVSQLYE